MADVIKKSGEKESFDPLKLRKSVEKAAIDADKAIPEETVRVISDKVQREFTNEKDVESSAIRTAILNEMDAADKSLSEAWRRFDKKYKVQARS